MELGLYLSENGNVMAFENFGTNLTRPKDESEVDQVTINTEARDVIRDLFPKIPDEDIALIIKTAFQKVIYISPENRLHSNIATG